MGKCEAGNYDRWLQEAPRLNEAEAWPRAIFPDADFTYFRECGCLVCALAVMLRQSGLERDGDLFDPWRLNQRLIDCGAFTPSADLKLREIRRLYPLAYVGPAPYSREALEQIVEGGSLCLLTVPGLRSERHFVTPLALLPGDAAIFDPLYGERKLSEYARVIDIREFRRVDSLYEDQVL